MSTKTVVLTEEQQVAENATLEIASAINGQTLNQLAIGRMFQRAIAAGYHKVLGFDKVKDYADKRFDWSYSTLAQFVAAAKIGEIAGWTDEQLLMVGVNGRSISALMRIGSIVQYCGKDAAEKGVTLDKLLRRCVGKKFEYIVAECNKLNPNGKGKVLTAITPKAKSDDAPDNDGTDNTGDTLPVDTITLTGDLAQRFLSLMGIESPNQETINAFFTGIANSLETPKVNVLIEETPKVVTGKARKTTNVAVN